MKNAKQFFIDKYQKLMEERNRLVNKKYCEGLDYKEANDLYFIRKELDILEGRHELR